jgi:microsomal dipeptidase-like Zn-dependent dipeptidase
MKPLRSFCVSLLLAAACALTGAARAGAQPVTGFVDLHSHLEAEHAFGGGWFWGTAEGPMETAVQRCDGNFPLPTHAATIFPILSELIGAENYNLFDGDTGWHLFKRRGYDRRHCRYLWPIPIPIPGTCPQEHFENWPRWDAIAHQQMWQGWLRQAHNGGLQVMVVSLAESNFLCSQTALTTRHRGYNCDEMESVYRQAAAVHAFASHNSSWVGIATTPAEARALIGQGKLALVLSVEVTKLFPTGNFITQLDSLRAQGIRSVQLAHHADSRFAGAAPIPELIKAANTVEFLWSLILGLPGGILGLTDITQINDIVCRDANGTGNTATCDGDTKLNEEGLSAEGDTLVRAMMDRGMLVDVSHVSRKAFRDVYAIAQQRGPYPILYSHAHMWDTIDNSKHHEKYIQQDEIHMITDTGGMVGLRPGPEKAFTYNPAIANRCDGTAGAFGQSLAYAVDHGLNVGFGADLNGFIRQMKPRYSDKCSLDRFLIDRAGGPTELQKKGLAHVGLLPELITDLRAVGVPNTYLDHLNRSAENFLVMWERSVSLGAPINMALSASASASSTYCSSPGTEHCYSPARVNDGNTSTALGGFTSWANDVVPMPQWVELAWTAPVTVSRVELFTTAGYPIREFRLEAMVNGGWTFLEGRTTNTDLQVTLNNFPPTPTTRLRIIGTSGPSIQPSHIRVNEFEVY